ncbi:hypothetical protein [Desulfosporosinus sp. OT]|uniref:hypothetical protein n=1 Tax=Desulfosporosinus sp. OT TaxID=913865 RepID=UPI0002239E33|nr:hypothetical protein [Desulfosporosinus sp. OT]EGW40084.1 hypothetical protein DOT_1799 [Desulfosporosinus sp. OT]
MLIRQDLENVSKEMNYEEYLKYVENVLKEETIEESATQLKTLGKFQESSDGLWEPVPYSGYTLITPTFFDDSENVDFYGLLSDLREELFWNILLPGTVWAPTLALHMTIGRLISGDVFATRIMNSREEEFLLALNQVSPTTKSRALNYEVKGLSIFPQGVIAAIVSPVTEDDYQRLQDFRNNLYTDAVLKQLGVERKRNFRGHITLFYLEEKLFKKESKKLAGAVADINRRSFANPLPFILERAEVRKFDNFSEFYRRDHWPVYRF